MTIGALPPNIQAAVDQLSPARRRELTEIRFRRGRDVFLVFPWGPEILTDRGRGIPVTDRLLRELLDRATNFSPYALKLEETGLYLPLENGCRMGLCGEAVMRDGRLWGLKTLSSVSIRIAREHRGVAAGTAKQLTQNGAVRSALIVSPPGGGKTTFLRDLIRCVSERGFRVSVADERRELGAVRDGVPTLDLGPNTDVLSGCPKAQAIPLLVRVMNPQVLALDELGSREELEEAQNAAFCGVALFASAHGDGISSLLRRPLYRQMLVSGAFDYCITLTDGHNAVMERLDGHAEISGGRSGHAGVADGRLGGPAGPEPEAPFAPAAAAGPGADAVGDGAEHGLRVRAV